MRTNLTANEKNIYNYCRSYPNEVYHLKIYELADKTFTTSSSISKLVKKLGFKNFQEFKLNIKEIFSKERNSLEFNSFLEEYINSLKNSVDIISEEKILEFKRYIDGFSTIILYGYGTSGSVARYLKNNLILLGYNAIYERSHTTCNVRSKFLKDGLFILISNSGETDFVVEIGNIARKNNCSVLGITSKGESPLGKLSNKVFLYKNGVIGGTSFENISYSIQIAVVDAILFTISKEQNIVYKFNSKEENE